VKNWKNNPKPKTSPYIEISKLSIQIQIFCYQCCHIDGNRWFSGKKISLGKNLLPGVKPLCLGINVIA
jgi:hypothetical protein